MVRPSSIYLAMQFVVVGAATSVVAPDSALTDVHIEEEVCEATFDLGPFPRLGELVTSNLTNRAIWLRMLPTSGSTNLGYGLQGDQVIISGIFQNSACEEWYHIQFRETQATGFVPVRNVWINRPGMED